MIKELTTEELRGMTIEEIKIKTIQYKNLLQIQEEQKKADENLTKICKEKLR